VEEKENQDDQKDRADAAAAVVAEARSEAITAESEYQNQDNQKDEHAFSVLQSFTALSVMQILMMT